VKRVHVWVRGHVQGVWFRESTRREAEARGVAGWVRNLPDGRVEAVLQGASDAVDAMVSWCRHGPPLARVADVQSVPEPVDPSIHAFTVVRGGA
jgi:acylphosphatase